MSITRDDPSDPDTSSYYGGPLTPLKLVRNGKIDTSTDYVQIFTKLQLKGDFQEEFFKIMKEYRGREDVQEVLQDPGNDLKEISEDFLKTYGKNIWMHRGPNNKQDPMYRETYLKWKDDQDKLWSLLDELWTRVRQLLWSQASESTLSIQDSPSSSSSDTGSTTSSMDAEEEAIAVAFINKVRVEVHDLSGSFRPRKQLIKSIEED